MFRRVSTIASSGLLALAACGAPEADGSDLSVDGLTSTLPSSALLPSTGACPTFHCAPEASGAMSLGLTASSYVTEWNPRIGRMVGQGCSGDGSVLACLVASDSTRTGTLKLLDPNTKSERWGSAKRGSFDLSMYAAFGQVPVLTSDHAVLAADDQWVARYDLGTGSAQTLKLSPVRTFSSSFGVVPLTGTRALVTLAKGDVFAFDAKAMRLEGKLSLRSATDRALTVVSPATASGDRAYLVTRESGGSLAPAYLTALELSGGDPAVRWTYPYRGTSGASAIVVTPQVSGRTRPIVVFHAPGRASGTTREDLLVALEDQGQTWALLWEKKLSVAPEVSPLIDPIHRTLILQDQSSTRSNVPPVVHTLAIDSGVELATVDLRNLAPTPGAWDDFVLNGHLVGTFSQGSATALVSAKGTSGQLVLGLDPGEPLALPPKPPSVRWSHTTNAVDAYTAAWTIHVRPDGVTCPVYVGSATGVNLLCPR